MSVLALLDVETTSLDPSSGHVVELAIGLFSIEHRSLVRSRSWLIAAPPDAVAETEHVHGIPPALVKARGGPFDAVCKMLHAIFMKEVDVVCCHNAAFDIAWLPPYLQKAKPVVCSCDDLVWPRPSTSRSLTALALAHGVGVLSAHRALDDVLTLARLFERAAELGADVEAMIRHGLRPKATFVANVSYDDREKAKAAGFRWEPKTKLWTRRMARDDVSALDFPVREVTA
jgi:DNA polymerase III subunit epsilon